MTAADIAILEDNLSDSVWRLTSGMIYKIKTADGRGIVPFMPRPEQVGLLLELLTAVEASKQNAKILHEKGEDAALAQMKLDVVQRVKLKARRLGFSTTIGVFVADCLGFRRNFTAALIDQIATDATRKMNDIVKVAMDSLMLVWPLHVGKSNDSELTVYTHDGGASTFYAGTRGRGGSCDFLWASELGVIQFDDSPRADEIVSGAFPSARWGVKFVETTWKGGRGGKLWDIIEPTMEKRSHDWHVSFCPWWKDPRNVSNAELDADSFQYFLKADVRLKHEFGVTLTDGQKRWWAQENRTQGIYMKRENPTFLDECWEAPVKGVIWAEAIAKARNEGRITNVPHDPELEVDSFWDLGAPDNTSIKFVQHRGGYRHLIASQSGGWSEVPDLVRGLVQSGYRFRTHFLPHDGAQTARTGATFEKVFREELTKQQCSGRLEVLPRATSIWPGVNHATLLFNSTLIDKSCTNFVKAAEAYRRRPDSKDNDRFLDEVVKDFTSHEADSWRYVAEADLLGFLPGTGNAVATRPFFDPGTLTVAASDAAANPARLVTLNCSDAPGRPVRHVTDAPDIGGWLRVWNGPKEGRRYLIVLIGRALQVWQSDGTGGPMALQAAPPWIQQPDHSLFYRWAAQISAFYGLAPICVDVVSHPGGVQELRRLGSFIMARQQVAGKRPLGQEEATMHEGWEWNKDVEQHALVTLQGRIRTGKIVLACPSLVVQCHEVQNSSIGTPEWREGVPVDLVQGAALASLCHDHASMFRAPIQQETGGHSVTGDRRNAPGRMRNR
jgi:hypothetical protein